VPMLALGMCVSYTASIGHARGLVPLASCLAVLVPAGLEWLGLLPKSYAFEAGRWIILPKVFDISRVATQAFVLTAIVGTIAPACFFVARLRRAYAEAERKLQLQAWQLRQILPDDGAHSS
jgi:eukaryotic-like serine/threonine-protein kinase